MAGNITIIVPKENFVKVPKGIVLNATVDTLALGIFVKVLCLGRESFLTIQDLAETLDLSLPKVQKAFAILEDAGFLNRTRVKGPDGRFIGWDYEISSEPLNTDNEENRLSEKPTIGKTDCRKIGLSVDPLIIINKDDKDCRDITNTTIDDSNSSEVSYNTPSVSKKEREEKKETPKETKEQKPSSSSSTVFRKPTVQEVADYCRARHNDVDAVAFVAFYESKGWMVGKNPMKDWKQAVITWEQRKSRSGRKTAPKESLGDYYTKLIQEMKDYYGTDSPDEQ